MQLSGVIAALQPSARGGYQSQNGYIYTFDMSITGQDGQQYGGEVGSKSQQYPMQVGSPITVESTTTEYGTRFKKINPQYQQGQQQGPPPQQQQQQGPTPYDRETEGKCICQVVCAGITSGQLKCEPDHIKYWVHLIMGKEQYPQDKQPNVSQQQQQPAQQPQGPGAYDPNAVPVDEIPF